MTDLLHQVEQAAPVITACAAAAKIIVDATTGRKRRRPADQPEPEPTPPPPAPESGFPWKKSAAAVGAVAAGIVVVRASRSGA
jgi:hypothetical protein